VKADRVDADICTTSNTMQPHLVYFVARRISNEAASAWARHNSGLCSGSLVTRQYTERREFSIYRFKRSPFWLHIAVAVSVVPSATVLSRFTRKSGNQLSFSNLLLLALIPKLNSNPNPHI